MPAEKIDAKRPEHADNELRKMQQRLVDDTIDDSFPASDPPAWTTTGAKSVAAKHDTGKIAEAPKDATVRRIRDQASSFAENAYQRSGEYLQQARRRFPEAERYSGQVARAIARPIARYPAAALLTAAAVGYGIAWLIHGRASKTQLYVDRRRAPEMNRRRSEHNESVAGTGPEGSGDSPKPHGDKYADIMRSATGEQSWR